MSAIQEKIKALKEQEEKLKLEQLKVEFLKHIEESVISYNQPTFASVKEDVVALVKKFVTESIVAIEGFEVKLIPNEDKSVNVAIAVQVQPVPVVSVKPKTEPELSPGEKMNFALDNRHLAGKKVSVLNDKNVDISGEVVGLDAPFVLVKTTTGPTIKVPLANVSLQ